MRQFLATTVTLPETTSLDVAGYSTALLGAIVTVSIAAIGAGFALFAVRCGVAWIKSIVGPNYDAGDFINAEGRTVRVRDKDYMDEYDREFGGLGPGAR